MTKLIKKILMIIPVTMLLMLVACGTDDIDKPVTGAITAPEYTTTVSGRIVRFKNDTVMLISESNGPIVLKGDMNFDGLKNGDSITIYCDDIMESYPAQTIVKEMIFHDKGTIDDVDSEELSKLKGMGYDIEE